MEFRFNLKKSYVFSIIAMIVLVGFAIAQTPPNPGHSGDNIQVTGVVGYPSLTSWSATIQTDVWNLLTRVANLENAKWTPINPVYGGPLCWPNAAGQCNPGVISTSIPSAYIPITAKEVLVYVWISRGSNGGGGGLYDFQIYTQEGSTRYTQKIKVSDNNNNGASVTNSDNLWLPVTSDFRIYVSSPSTLNGNFNTGVEFLGYR